VLQLVSMAALVAIAGLTSGQLLLQLYCVQLRLLKGVGRQPWQAPASYASMLPTVMKYRRWCAGGVLVDMLKASATRVWHVCSL
jgi:hypothetical protein